MEPNIRSLVHGKQIFTSNCVGCHGMQGNGQGPARVFINNPAPRNFRDASAQLFFSDGELYDAILFGIDGTAMPPFGDILTVNDIWDVTNFIRTIPNGGLEREDLDSSMMVSPADIKPIEQTPLALTPAPGNIPAITPTGGLGQTGGQQSPGGTPARVGTVSPTSVPTARPESGPGAGGEPTRAGVSTPSQAQTVVP